MDITLKQMQIFRAVVIAGSITKASRRVGLSQPSISQQLAKLEERLGTQLINRNRTGSVSLTPSGEYWFKFSDEVLRKFDQAIDEHEKRYVDSRVFLRIGLSPTLRGRFLSAAARIASEEPGFAKFEVTYATTSSELVEQLRLHQLNCVIVNDEALAEDRSSFSTALLFRDPMALLIPAEVPQGMLEKALAKGVKPAQLDPAFARYVEISSNVPMRPVSDAWYRAHLPFATPAFTAMTYVAAADIVAEGLATAHVPLSLLPSLPGSVRNRVRVYTLPGMDRSIVLAMPKHLMTLLGYANIFKRLTDFCRNEYSQNVPKESLLELPHPERPRTEREAAPVVAAADLQQNFQ
ncbi:MAG: LysR family transcriptional regulator [Devosia sp.]|uniref:LysR family transcriptional regulator n=1 Tax=Devosia sp. TaxID=1871048 RepID=UPI001ACCA022|nr:LysR family transcriptional regulator [Devosia sp.]MBN9309924.1 LysR family transcriptional regulator [Devosia sp.]MBN9316650.1 LysR family transcriptional regulator [Devosia sp.]